MTQKQKQKNYEEKHKVNKTNVIFLIYCVNICKHEHEKNITKLWCARLCKIGVEQTK